MIRELNCCNAGEFADGLAFCFEYGAGGGQRPGEDKAGEGAVDAAARMNALDDLLAEVAERAGCGRG